MNNSESPLYWSFPGGTWFRIRVRISFYFPLIVFVICVRLEDLRLGLIVSTLLFFSILFHEIGHVLGARLTGGSGDQILIWPLGGLAAVYPAGTFKSRLLTTAAGPVVNLLICGLMLATALQSMQLSDALNPLVFPSINAAKFGWQEMGVLLFKVNWMLFCVNLIPVYPLDGGRILQTCLMTRWSSDTATLIYVRIGLFVGFAVMVLGLLVKGDFSSWVVAIGATILLLNMQESYRLQSADAYEESFMGYDFSQGYTSLERSGDSVPEHRPGLFRRWQRKRQAEKRRRTREKQADAERLLDELLQKVHDGGMQSLTEAERRKLRRASDRFREKDQN